MRVLLLRPRARERFGLGPFFRTEPLGLEYLAAALLARGHEVEIVDLRLERSARRALLRTRPEVVGISCVHTIDVPASISLARKVRLLKPDCLIVAGGRGAASSASSFASSAVDMVCEAAGERSFVELVHALERGGAPDSVAGFIATSGLRQGRVPSQSPSEAATLRGETVAPDGIDPELRPARHLVERYRRGYRCVHRAPLWALETSRGCPYRCSFCAVGRAGGAALRAPGAVLEDFERVGADVFVVDDLFFHPRDRSIELGRSLAQRAQKKQWLLVQTRTDTVVRNAEALAAWRPLAEKFDLFMGFEAASDDELARLNKDAKARDAEEAVRVARALGFGVTGNFVVDPDWAERDFEQLWETLEKLALDRVGFTVLTPLPGTEYFERSRARLLERDPARWDMHHVLWEPRLGRRRFYELMVQSWKHNVLAGRHAPRRWRSWFRGLGLRDTLALTAVLWRTQRLLDVDAYLDDTFAEFPAALSD